MANTIKYDNNRIVIYPDGTTDFDITALSNKFAKGIKLFSLEFHPSAINDYIRVRSGSATGTVMAYMKDTVGCGLIKYFPGNVEFPYIRATDCSWTTAASSIIILTGAPA
jgi:hypothetical protein